MLLITISGLPRIDTPGCNYWRKSPKQCFTASLIVFSSLRRRKLSPEKKNVLTKFESESKANTFSFYELTQNVVNLTFYEPLRQVSNEVAHSINEADKDLLELKFWFSFRLRDDLARKYEMFRCYMCFLEQLPRRLL